MRAYQARLIFVAFLGVTAAIAYNATFRQNGYHPAPYAGQGDASGGGERQATSNDGRQAPSEALPPAAGSDTVRAIQRELAVRDYAPGPVDGVAGLQTIAAIIAYQHDNELAVTGRSSTSLLQHIVLGETSEPMESGPSEEAANLIRAVQQSLAELGYAPGPLDGIVGGSTRRAIESFERERGLPVTGRISGKLVGEITRTTGAELELVPSG